jgi:hypothetical protein
MLYRMEMSDKIKVQDSFYSYVFDDIDSQHIYQLSNDRSEEIWSEFIHKKANTYFHLPDDHWLVRSEDRVVARWFDDYNSGIPDNVGHALSKAVPWLDDDEVWFCINRSTILECSWRDFRAYWINFLCAHNDGPIIINSRFKFCAFIFYRHNVVLVGSCRALYLY